MRNLMGWFSGLTIVAVFSLVLAASQSSAPDISKPIYQFKMPDIQGKQVAFDKYKGKVLLVVNVASKCGLTPQYEALEKTYQKYKAQGLVVMGFPANEFGNQEPGSNTEIQEFCSKNYGVSFPMFSKIVVKGEGIHPLYQWLLKSTSNEKDIEWNFAKFLVDRNGKVLHRFRPQSKPDSAEITAAIEAALKS